MQARVRASQREPAAAPVGGCGAGPAKSESLASPKEPEVPCGGGTGVPPTQQGVIRQEYAWPFFEEAMTC